MQNLKRNTVIQVYVPLECSSTISTISSLKIIRIDGRFCVVFCVGVYVYLSMKNYIHIYISTLSLQLFAFWTLGGSATRCELRDLLETMK